MKIHTVFTSFTTFFLTCAIVIATPGISQAFVYEPFEISGWIPYWREDRGIRDAAANIDVFTEVNPFVYTVKQNGELNDAGGMTEVKWRSLQDLAEQNETRFIPTIMWSNADAMHDVLSDPAKRQEHIRAIASEVFAHGFDGIDIDYEGKYARTRDHYSAFLDELYEAIGYNKWVMCTTRARTPPSILYRDIPSGIEYADDLQALNENCDRVRVMTYDQGRAVLGLNDQNGDPYAPVADIAWVEEVMTLMAQDINPNKLVVGVPTYGYEYDMFESGDGSGELEYSRLWSFNPGYATTTAEQLDIEPTRSPWGELMMTYPAKDAPDGVVPLADATRVMAWSDAYAIQQKIAFAQDLGLRGIAIFKIDGGQDQNIFEVLQLAK